jgi:glycosyltransferase involved in cell wall biosynthesis
MPDRPLTLAYLGDPNSIHTRRWVSFFAHRGHSTHLLVPSLDEVEPGLDRRIELHPFVPYYRRQPHLLGAVEARRSLAQTLALIGPDLLHAHYLTVHGWHARLSGFRPYLVTVWGSDVYVTPPATLRGRLWARLTLRSAAVVTADSRDLASATVQAGARRERTHVVQFGVDSSRFAPGPYPEGLARELGLWGRRVIFVPRIIAPVYRTITAVEALARLADDVTLVLSSMAARPEYLGQVQRRIEDLGVGNRTLIVPMFEHPRMADLYRLADVVLSIPQTDGTPVSLLEAMATGRPVVASDLPSVREWLADIAPASLVPVGDVPATSAALHAALAMAPADRERMGGVLRKRVVERADHATNLLRMESLYRSVAGAKAR